MPDWELADVEEKAADHPRTFFIPTLEERRTQAAEDEVQLHFVMKRSEPGFPNVERMWVSIVERAGDPPRYAGLLMNQPAYIADLNPGDRIFFGPEHIARILIKEGDPWSFEAVEKRALVSKRVFEDGETVRWMYRESPDNPDDSGWRLFTGSETAEYLENPENFRRCVITWLLDFDPTLLPAIRAEAGAAFERSSPSEAWARITDWRPPEDL